MKINKIWNKLICFAGGTGMLLSVFSTTVSASEIQYWPEGPQVQSASAIVMEINTGTMLYEKNIHDQHYPASITKILTTLLAVENSNMDEVVTFSEDAVFKTEGSGIARDVGEEMTMEQCLYAVMLASSNESAYAVAEHVAGDITSFVQLMNERAATLGCQNTHFNNCHGLPDEQHYTSAYDMALIAREAYHNENFRIICGTKTYTIPFTNKHTDEETYLQNHHQMLYPYRTREHLYDYCLGGKTGYTMAANSTLVTYAEKDGMTLVCVVLDAPGSAHYEDTRALLDFCFDNYKKLNVAENETDYSDEQKDGGSELSDNDPFVSLDHQGSVILPVTAEFKDAESEIIYDYADKNILGSIQYTYANRTVGRADIVATDAKIEQFRFQSEDDTSSAVEEGTEQSVSNKEKKVFQINLRLIGIVAAAVVAIVILIFILVKVSNGIYRMKRNYRMNHGHRSPYKSIKMNKSRRRRRRRR